MLYSTSAKTAILTISRLRQLSLDLGEAEEDRQRRHEEDAAADADQAAGEAAGDRDQDRQDLVHLRISSIAIATSRAAKR